LVATPVLFPPPAHHPDLHSFPTRRSSDLARARDGARARLAADAAQVPDRGVAQVQGGGGGRVRHVAVDRQRGGQRAALDPEALRSEEHTSELQSRSDLVCRLLLEKKKKET